MTAITTLGAGTAATATASLEYYGTAAAAPAAASSVGPFSPVTSVSGKIEPALNSTEGNSTSARYPDVQT
jgi:hypothetical protein